MDQQNSQFPTGQAAAQAGGASAPAAQGHGQAEELHPLFKFVQEHAKPIIIGLGALLLVLGSYAVYDYLQERNLAQAREELGAILVRSVGTERIESLRKFLPDAPSSMRPAVEVEIAQALFFDEKYAEAAESWGKVAQETEGQSRIVALLARGQALKSAGDMQAAVDQFDALLASAPEPYHVPILRQMAIAAEEGELWDTAIKAYQGLLDRTQTQDAIFYREKLKMLESLKQG